MTGFAAAEEIEKYIGGIFMDALNDEELGPKLAPTGLVRRIHCKRRTVTSPLRDWRIASDHVAHITCIMPP